MMEFPRPLSLRGHGSVEGSVTLEPGLNMSSHAFSSKLGGRAVKLQVLLSKNGKKSSLDHPTGAIDWRCAMARYTEPFKVVANTKAGVKHKQPKVGAAPGGCGG